MGEGVLAVVVEDSVRIGVDRVAAAAGVRVVHVAEPSSAKVWAAARTVLVDLAGVRRCTDLGLPRRSRVFVVTSVPPDAADWPMLIAVGAHAVLVLPSQEADLVAVLSDAGETGAGVGRRGPVVAVIGARGGAGATVFAAALAQCAEAALLVDVDPWGGGVDLVMGTEAEPGLRWPDLALQGGRVGWDALNAALPSTRGVAVLSAGRGGRGTGGGTGGGIEARALDAVVNAGSRAGVTVVCDLPRRPGRATETAVAAADLVVVVTPAELRACASAPAVGEWVSEVNANVGLIVRGPAPGGLTAAEVARTVGYPLVASMRAQPDVTGALERSGLRLRRRSPLAGAAKRVLAVLHGAPAEAGVA